MNTLIELKDLLEKHGIKIIEETEWFGFDDERQVSTYYFLLENGSKIEMSDIAEETKYE